MWHKAIMALAAACAATAGLGQGAPQQELAPPVISGSVVRAGAVQVGAVGLPEVGGLPRVKGVVKVAGANGDYRATLEVEGVALSAALEKAEVKKKTDDGFSRPLDLYIVVSGRSGQRALFSWGELFARADAGPLLVPRLRLRVPSHHEAIDETVYPAGLLPFDAPGRQKLDLKSCSPCHGGPKPPKLDVPAGWCLVTPEDGFGGRFVEDVIEIRVEQVGIAVGIDKETGKKLSEKGFVGAPAFVGLDGKAHEVGPDRLAAVPRRKAADATIGMGRGYHGTKRWEGVDLGDALRAVLPVGPAERDLWVLVTALDGYRALYSGSEVFTPRRGEGVLLVDREDDKALGPGSGRLKSLATGDFFIDRAVRLVKEIRIGRAR